MRFFFLLGSKVLLHSGINSPLCLPEASRELIVYTEKRGDKRKGLLSLSHDLVRRNPFLRHSLLCGYVVSRSKWLQLNLPYLLDYP